MPTFRARVIYFWQLSIESPCMNGFINLIGEMILDKLWNLVRINILTLSTPIANDKSKMGSLDNIFDLQFVQMSLR